MSESEAISSAIDLGLNTFITGLAGSGKTSMLRHVQWRLDGCVAVVVYVNLEAARLRTSRFNRWAPSVCNRVMSVVGYRGDGAD